MSDHLIETLDAGVCTLTMNRPEARNAMSGSMMAALNEAIPYNSAPVITIKNMTQPKPNNAA